MRFWRNIPSLIMGDVALVRPEGRIYNAATFSSALIALMITVGDTLHNIGDINSLFTLIPTGIFASLYIIGRLRGVNLTLVLAFSVVGILSMVYDWIFFYGLRGTSLFIAFTIAVVVPSISKGILRAVIMTIHFTCITLLFILEYCGLVPVGEYPSANDHISDLYMTSIFLMIGLLILISYIVHNYNDQKARADRLNMELENANRHLTESLSAKNEFFSIISHDLRGPVGALSSLGQLLSKQDDLDEDEKGMIIDSIQVSSKQALGLLDNLLYWARVETGQMKPNTEKVDLERLTRSNLELLSSNITAKELRIEADGLTEKAAFFDKEMMALIIRNLLSNAIKFTPSKGIISITSERVGKYVEYSVADTGVGISEGDLDKLFNIESNITTIGTEREKGTGLGLKLCKQFIDKNGGKIRVNSVVNKGSIFVVSLPASS